MPSASAMEMITRAAHAKMYAHSRGRAAWSPLAVDPTMTACQIIFFAVSSFLTLSLSFSPREHDAHIHMFCQKIKI